MPLNPATIRATAQRVVDEWAMHYPTQGWLTWNAPARDRFVALVQAGADLAAQSHATALADAEREAARRAWDAARNWEQASQFAVKTPGMFNDARDRYLARAHPSPAPREVVTVEVNDDIGSCFRVGYDDGWYAVGDKPGTKHTDLCKLVRAYSLDVSDEKMRELAALPKAFATTEGAR